MPTFRKPKTRRRDSKATWVILTADWHVNSTIGLCPPEGIPRDDGQISLPSPEQQWQWGRWLDSWAYVDGLDGYKVAVVMADVFESFHHGSVQIATLNQADELRAGNTVAQPMLEVVDEVHVLRGTEAHSGGASYKEELFAERIGAVPNEERGTWSSYYLTKVWGGVKFDLQHHPRTSSRVPHTRDWAAAREATYVCVEYDNDGICRPDVIGRGHVHYHGKGYHQDTFCVFCPPWQFTTSFGHRLGSGRHVEKPGNVLFRCEGGEYTWQAKRYRMPGRRPW